MATRKALEDALMQADQSGDAEGAQVLAGMINAGEYDTGDDIGAGRSFVAGASQGATLGAGDEISGGIRKGMDAIMGSVMDKSDSAIFEMLNPGYTAEQYQRTRQATKPKTYADFRDQARNLNASAEAANPLAYLGGEIGAGLTQGLAGGAKAAAGQTFRQAVPRLAALGAAEGGGAGLGYSEGDTLPELAAATAQGAGTGAVLGTALPGVARGVGTATRKTVDFFGSKHRAAREIMSDLKDADLTLDDAQRLLDENPDMILADLSENLQQRLGAVANTPGRGPQMAKDILESRNIEQLSRLQPQFEAALGSAGILEAAQAAAQRTRDAAGPLYDQAYATPIHSSERLKQLLELPSGKMGVKRAKKTMLEAESIANGDGPLTVEFLDHVQRGMREHAKALDRGQAAQHYLAGQTRKHRQELLSIVDGMTADANGVSPFKTARKIAADSFAERDALELGRKAFNTRMPELKQALGEMSESEATHFRIGVFDDLMEKLGNKSETANLTQDFKKPNFKEKIRWAFSNDGLFQQFERSLGDEAVMFDTMRKALQGSPTYSRQAFGGLSDSALGVGANLMAGREAIAMAEAAKSVFGGLKNKLITAPLETRPAGFKGDALLSNQPQDVLQQLLKPTASPVMGAPTAGLSAPAALDPELQLRLLTQP